MSKLILPEKFQSVDISRNPFDLRPVFSTVMEAENWLLDRMPKDQSLADVFAERHNSKILKIMQAAIVSTKHTAALENIDRSFAVGVESPTNAREANAGHLHELATEEKHAHLFKVPVDEITSGDDPDGKKILTMLGIFKQIYNAPDLNKEFYNCVISNNISYANTDIAWRDGKNDYIDQNDDAARDLINRVAPHLSGTDIKRHGANIQDGMMLSNHAMVENSIAHMGRANTRLYFLSAGATHVFGINGIFPYQDSVAAVFEKHGVVPLVIAPSDRLTRAHSTRPENGPPTVYITGFQGADRIAARISDEAFIDRVNKFSGLSL